MPASFCRWLIAWQGAPGGALGQVDQGRRAQPLPGGKGKPEDAELRSVSGASSRCAWSWDQPSNASCISAARTEPARFRSPRHHHSSFTLAAVHPAAARSCSDEFVASATKLFSVVAVTGAPMNLPLTQSSTTTASSTGRVVVAPPRTDTFAFTTDAGTATSKNLFSVSAVAPSTRQSVGQWRVSRQAMQGRREFAQQRCGDRLRTPQREVCAAPPVAHDAEGSGRPSPRQ